MDGRVQEDDTVYPYTARDDTCTYDRRGTITPSGYYKIAEDPDSIRAAIYRSAQAVAIAAGNPYFGSYKSGILMDTSACDY